VAKAWYNYFLVTDPQSEGRRAAEEATGAEAAPAPRRVADLVADDSAASDALVAADASAAGASTTLTALADIYSSAQIAAPAHGYTVLKVADMLQSEHIRTLPSEVKRKSILVALEAAGVTVDEIVEDAVHRDRALDTYERVLLKSLDDLRSEKQAENARLEQEIAERLAELRARIDQNNQGLASEQANLQAWQTRKQNEERRIAEAVSYFVTENPISTGAAAADGKGDANAR
jgi:hypothetical protein